MRHVYARGEVQTGLLWENRKERVHFEDLGVDGKILKCILKTGLSTGLIWIRTEKSYQNVVKPVINIRVP